MPTISRALLNHPALGTAGGSGLYTSIDTIYKQLGDYLNSRFFVSTNVANGDTVDFYHNFKCNYPSQIRVLLYSYNESNGLLARITRGGSPDLNTFIIAAKPSFETTHLSVTNNSGSEQDLAILILQADYPQFNVVTKNANFTANLWDKVLVDTTGGSITAQLPTGAVLGDQIIFIDKMLNFHINKFTISSLDALQYINDEFNNSIECVERAKIYTATFVKDTPTARWLVSY